MAQFLWIPWRLPKLNELLDQRGRVFRKSSGKGRVSRSGKPVTAQANGYSVLKKQWEQTVWLLARTRGFSVAPGCWDFTYLFVEPDAKFDPSNIGAAAAKLIEDALQGSKKDGRESLMAGDGWATVHSIHMHFTKVSERLPIPGVLLGYGTNELSQLEMIEQAGRMVYAERVHTRERKRSHAAEGAVRRELLGGNQPMGEAPSGAPAPPGAGVRAQCAAEDGGGTAGSATGYG